MTRELNQIPKTVSDAIEESLALVEAEYGTDAARRQAESESLPSLLEECEAWRQEVESEHPEPIRMVHHFACTGGTLISKCLASLPNAWLLSEVDPLSELYKPPGRFSPTDFINLIRNSTREAPADLLQDIFMASLGVTARSAINRGLRLIIRDHTHSHYCTGSEVKARPTIADIVARERRTISIVTTRDPVDSYVSLVKNEWLHFEPGSVDEYAARYMKFLEDYKHAKLVRYEEFVQWPEMVMRQMADELEMPYDDCFMDVFNVYDLSGDSGRSGREICARPRQEIPEEICSSMTNSKNFQLLRHRLGYG
ncbi:sulfotransferase family protein [Natronospira bacteriovora]|uniref:Sulfotransferase family protein n=1 Tax=Natronospira bacteriovora TaxID=3069753 RepID=A0ABU0W9N9_9GAMM|nr:sulfotransferase family protein [Natronospira sp. AB-CW4]MDQ2070150.1 sulfotransferase family protein [Natronospira sp. AB-CW4]